MGHSHPPGFENPLPFSKLPHTLRTGGGSENSGKFPEPG